jgi:prepilin-type N-terminal cleavage/methylation domain-containing protein
MAGRGFTIVELACVLVILGILIAHAIPRFADIADDAHQAVVAQTAGALQTAVMQAFIGCVISDHAGKDNLPGFGDGTVDLNANCFPSSTNGNNGNVNGNRCVQVWNGVLAIAPSISTPANDTTEYRAQGSGTTCTYTYRNDDDVRRFTYSTATGDINIVANP